MAKSARRKKLEKQSLNSKPKIPTAKIPKKEKVRYKYILARVLAVIFIFTLVMSTIISFLYA